MPNKMTYGKTKKSILTLLPGLKDGDRSTQSPKPKSEKRASATLSMAAFYGKQSNGSHQKITMGRDDSIEEIPSMLIDDTTMNQLMGEPGKRLSQVGSAKILQHATRQEVFHDKALPRLPRLSLDRDDGPSRSGPAITSVATVSKKAKVFDDEAGLDSFPPPVSRQLANVRESSAPPLPRKSSKRRPRQRKPREAFESKDIILNKSDQAEPRKLSRSTQQILKSPSSSSNDNTNAALLKSSPNVSQQIEAMLAASKALKLEVVSPLINSSVLSKESAMTRSTVLSKMKNAITNHLHDKGHKKRYNLANSEHLLDPNLSQLPDYDEEISTISAMELRINEGINFGNPKIKNLTGHGTVRRKPIADDGRSLMSRDSVEVSSLRNAQTLPARGPKSFDSTRYSSVSIDRSAETASSPPARLHRVKGQSLKRSVDMKVGPIMEADFDALFSSSPIAQSTPRIRLEPAFKENGNKTLRNVFAESRSLFDPDISLCEPCLDLGTQTASTPNAAPRKLLVKRNNSHVKDVGLGVKVHTSKRRKKHPSPSKAELEGLEDALAHYSPRTLSLERHTQGELSLSFGDFRTRGVLKAKDENAPLLQAPLLQAPKRGEKGSRSGIFGKSTQAVAGPSMAEPARRPALKGLKASMIPKPAGAPTMKHRTEVRKYHLMTQGDESAMDTDELQWESTAYHIGMRG